MAGPPVDPWSKLAHLTPARIALGRAGASLPTREWLAFALAHARARDAVHRRLDAAAIMARLSALGLEALQVESEAPERPTYLARPDLGRQLSAASRALLAKRAPAQTDLAFVIGDGLSAGAVEAEAVPLIAAVRRELASYQIDTGRSTSPSPILPKASLRLEGEGDVLRPVSI